jgi:putative ABC transport system permease protein
VTFLKLPLFWKISAGEVRRRPGRALLTLLGIVIGVGATVAIAVTVQTTRYAHRDMFEALTGRASLEVVAEGLGGFNADLAERLSEVPGLRAAVPVIQTPAALLGKSGAVPILVLGVDPVRDGAARDYVLRQGQMLDGHDGLLLEAGFAGTQGLTVGQSVRLLTPTGFTMLPVVGLLEPSGAATFNGGAVAFMPLPTAQRLFGLAGRINSVQLVLAADASSAPVEAAVRQRLPAGLTVQAPGARGEFGRESMASTEQGLTALSASSLVAGAFVILNAFRMNLGERRRQLAVLRALGATRRQVRRLLLREALAQGVLGTVLGIPAGLGLAVVLRGFLARVLVVTLPGLRLSATPFLIAAVLGPGLALAATIIPARRAGQRAPLADLLPGRGDAGDELRRWPGYLGLALLGTVAFLVLALRHGWLPSALLFPLLAPSMAMYLGGCALLVPLLLTPLSGLAAWVLRPLLGVEGGLALRLIGRHPARTALTVGVLLIAVVFAIGYGQSFRNNMRDLHQWFDQIVQTDFYVRGTWPDATVNITTAAVPEALADEVRTLEGVEHVDRFNFVMARAGSRQVVVLAYSFTPGRPVPLALMEGEPAAVCRDLLQGEVVAGTALAQRLGVGVGDTLTLETRRGPQTLRVAGITAEYTGGGMAVYMDWQAARRLFDFTGVHVLLVTARPGEAAALGDRLRAFCEARGLLFQDNAEVHRVFARQLEGFLGFVWVLLSLVFVVASLGVVNTLTMNVLEQTRELGVLRALGLRRVQVGKLVVCQALALGVLGLLPGLVGGIGLTYLIHLSTYPLSGRPVPFHLEGTLLGGCLAAALVIAVTAAVLPARRAARLPVIQALQYE